jgi:hypothetical protein
MLRIPALVLALVASVSSAAFADYREEKVGLSGDGATVKGSIKGDDSVHYIVNLDAGEKLTVSMTTSNRSSYFNVLPLDSDNALFVGSSEGLSFSGAVPDEGDYVVQVYLMRNAARRNETANYTLRIAGE